MRAIGELLNFRLQSGCCEAHGDFESFGGVCPDCFKAEQALELVRSQEAYAAEELALRRQRSGLPARFMVASFEDFAVESGNAAQAKAKAIAQRYVSNYAKSMDEGRGLLLYGGVGTGKTLLAAAVVNAVLERGKSARFLTATQAVRMVKDTFNRSSEQTERQVMEAFVKPYLLVLDELGVQVGTDTERNVLLEIINDRYNALKPMIITSNLDLNGLEELIGVRALDRLREVCVMLPMQWESYRGRV